MVEEQPSAKKEASAGEGIRMVSESSAEVSEGFGTPEETEAVGTLTIRYVNDIPEITLSGGTAIPGEIVVVDSEGNPVARYTGSALSAGPATRGHAAVVHGRAGLLGTGLLSDRALKRDVVGVVWAW